MSDFLAALEYVLKNEGTMYTNNPSDAGGPTRYGITLATLASYRKNHGLSYPSAIDVQNLTLHTAADVYKELYWDALNLDKIKEQRVALALFDIGVNRGVGIVARDAQQICGTRVDGELGDLSIAAINKMDPNAFLCRFIPMVQNAYVQIVLERPTQIVFLKGWLSRSQKLISLMVA